MRRIVGVGLLVAVLFVMALAGAAAATAPQVVIILCQGTPGATLFVAESSSSAGAPVVANGTPCAQAVSDLLAAPLKLVAYTSAASGVVYTFSSK